MSQETFIEKQEKTISIQIFSVSASMIGVCLTVIGIINIINRAAKVDTWADDFTAIGAIVFLCSCVISYLGIRTEDRKRRLLLEKVSDAVFLTGLSILALVCVISLFKLFYSMVDREN